MRVIAVGQPYDPSIKEWPEGCHYNFDSAGHWLHYLFRNPSKVEKTSIQKGSVRFGIYIQGPVIFLLHKFGDMAWNDAPYSFWLVPEEYRKIPDINDQDHAFLRTVLIDTTTVIVEALRALTFSAQFTRRLHEEIVLQSLKPWDPASYDAVIQSTYSNFSASELVKHSVIFCNGGD
mgnify:CR=1 FL=1